MVELFTGPAKEKCNLEILHNLTLRHLIAVLGFRALISYCHGDWMWLLSGGMCDCKYSVRKGNSLGGLKNNSCKLVVVCVKQAQCWVMILVLVLPLPDGWSKSHLRAFREETCFEVSCSLSEGGMCDSAGMMLNKSELKVPHTTVAELWNSVKSVI